MARAWRVPVIEARTEDEDGSKSGTKLTTILVRAIVFLLFRLLTAITALNFVLLIFLYSIDYRITNPSAISPTIVRFVARTLLSTGVSCGLPNIEVINVGVCSRHSRVLAWPGVGDLWGYQARPRQCNSRWSLHRF